ncbi:MAG: VPA1262 family N-terminal domain-containing protein, partial [Methylococcales bacterium]
MQFWLLQLKTGGTIESRLLYGRALPYNFSNNKWSATRSDKFVKYDGFDAHVISINLYCSPEKLVDIVKDLSNGDDLSNLNEKNALSFSYDKDKDRFGSYSLDSKLAFRPVSYLPMRNDYSKNGLKSVHGSAGAFSASLTNLDKSSLFRIGDIEDKQLLKDSIEKLDSETGLDFLNGDAARLGDLEFLVFPTLDECERELFFADLV